MRARLPHVLRAPRFWRTLLVMAVFCGVTAAATMVRPLSLSLRTEPQSQPVAEAVTTDPQPVHEALPQAGRRQTVESDLFDDLIQPFKDVALARRAERARTDPTYALRVDPELNATRINFLLFGYGETYEPPHPPDIIGSITILSLDYSSRKFAQISLTHDARAPEIERYLAKRGIVTNPSKIDQTYKIGGFDLMREAVENATGLSIDFQVAVEDVVIMKLVDDVVGTINLDSPFALDTNPIYVRDVWHQGTHFDKGVQQLDGLRTLHYLKGIMLPPYDPAKENNLRKRAVFSAISERLQQNITNPVVAFKAVSFLRAQLDSKAIAYDFDMNTLVVNAIKTLAGGTSSKQLTIPAIDQNLYLVDEQFGDGGFTWVMGTQNPIIKDELQRGIYKDTAMVVPDGDPYAPNLATGYWTSVRRVVKFALTPGLLRLPAAPFLCSGPVNRVRTVPIAPCEF